MILKIEIPGKPIAKARPKFARMGKFTKVYSTQQTEEGLFLLSLKSQTPNGFIKKVGPVNVEIMFDMKRPAAHYGTGKNKGVLKKNANIWNYKKPDIDNLIKFVFDCINISNLVWHDDSQVVSVLAEKRYSNEPKTTIYIEDVDGI